MDMMGSFPETEVFMENQPKADLGPVVAKLVQGKSPVLRPVPILEVSQKSAILNLCF